MSVFFCYSSADADLARSVRDKLVVKMVPVWMDTTDILPGENWQQRINAAIHHCTHFLVLVSSNSVASDEVEAEWGLAIDLGKKIIPILTGSCDVPYRLRKYQCILLSNSTLDSQIDRLILALPILDLPRLTSQPLSSYASEKQYAQMILDVSQSKDGKNKSIWVDPCRYSNLQALLDDIFSHKLVDSVEPYSYGLEWIIRGEPFNKYLIAPIEWIRETGRSISEVAPDWSISVSPNEVGIVKGSFWDIVLQKPAGHYELDYIKSRAYGVVTNDSRIYNILMKNAKAIAMLRSRFRVSSLEDPALPTFKHQLVLSDWLNTGLVGKIAIDRGGSLSERERRFLRL